MMAEYIDRNELKKRVRFSGHGMYYDAYEVQEMPNADVVERKRGRWEPSPTAYGFVRCGNCKDELSEHWDGLKKWAHCNVCGADMRENPQ